MKATLPLNPAMEEAIKAIALKCTKGRKVWIVMAHG